MKLPNLTHLSPKSANTSRSSRNIVPRSFQLPSLARSMSVRRLRMDISERNFEATIEAVLLAHGPESLTGDADTTQDPPLSYGQALPGGYHKRRPDEYNRSLCLIPQDVIEFIYATQPKEWDKLK